MAYVLMTDSGADLPPEYYQSHDLPMLPIYFSLGGKTIPDDAGQTMPYKDFYDAMRAGAMPTTAAINPADYVAAFTPFFEQGRDILYLAFSSGLSSSVQSARMAAGELAERFPERRAVIVDTLCASLGQGLFVHLAAKMRNAGKTLDEVGNWAEANKLNVNHLVTVDDLMHLHRGGRVSRTSALMGTLIGIKPMIYMNHDGKLIVDAKKRGRKAALARLVEWMGEYTDAASFDAVTINHSDCLEDAQYVEALVREKYTVGEVIIHYIGAAIGAHTGPGTVSLFFLGKTRQK